METSDDNDSMDGEHSTEEDEEEGNVQRRQCKSATSFKKYLHECIGSKNRQVDFTLQHLLIGLMELEVEFACSKTLMQRILDLLHMVISEEDKLIVPPTVHLVRATMDMRS